MSPSTNATRRSARDGNSHLTLVPSQDAPRDDAPRPAKPVEQPRALTIVGSATARALIALGALASALGIPLDKAEVVYWTHEVHPGKSVDEADPSGDNAPVATTPKRVATHESADKTQVSAGYWAPAIKPVEVVVYKMPAPIPGTGRHRRPTIEHHTYTRTPSVGRHRKPDQQSVEPCGLSVGGRQGGGGVEVSITQPPQMVMATVSLDVPALPSLGRK